MAKMTFWREPFRRASGPAGGWVRGLIAAAWVAAAAQAHASLEDYDQDITDDDAGGLSPVARLTTPVTLTGANRASFDFGPVPGDATFEFILEGNPAAIPNSAYLAVGSNATSNLRYEQYNNTGQLGFTQLGVADYLFTPAVLSPTEPTHLAYVWDAAGRTMKLYVNGLAAGSRSAVTASFAMPAGPGWLGANPSNAENMVGTIHRVTAYADRLADEVILRHADAFRGIMHPPFIVSFTANPDVVFTPAGATLAWEVQRAAAAFLDGAEVATQSNLTVFPDVTTTYTLTATNTGGSASAQVTVRVNPPPIIHHFRAHRTYVATGETVIFSWNVSYGQQFSISPDVGDVTAQTVNGAGSVDAHPAAPTTYTFIASNAFGLSTAEVAIHLVHPADHLVISEFMADDESTLADEDGEFSGWIEIHNPTAAALTLAGHFLTDDPAEPEQWPFPDLEVLPGGYQLVWASGKNRTNAAAPLHTNFRLNNAGDYLALVGPGPVLVHAYAPEYPPQRDDISYGLLGGDPALERYLGVPTPGTDNDETPPPPALVEFSHPSGLFTEPFTVTLTSPDPDAEIFFTLDGSAPGLTNGTRYTTPLAITQTTRLRAVALAYGQTGGLSGASYVRLAPELAGYTSSLPLLVIENFGAGVIPQKGWNSTGAGLKQMPRQPAVWAAFERVGGVSTLSNAPQMVSLVGIRGRGAYSTQWRQKPYSAEAMDEHGEEVKVAPLGMPAHADWVLYFPDPDQNKDPTLLFNTFAYELSGRSGHYAARFRWVEVFINEDGGDLQLADRRGVYALIEKVARGKDRLDFQRLSPDGTTGGWLLNINRMDPEPDTGWPAPNGATEPWFFHTAGADRILETPPNTNPSPVPGDDQPRQYNAYLNFDNPNGYVINANQRAAIEDWFRQFEDVLYNDALWRDPTDGYRSYIDAREWADYFVLNVLTRNGDGLLISLFPWKGDDGRLRIGPAWDYNWNAYYISGGPTGNLMHRSDRLWYARLFTDPDFLQLYIDRWWDLRRGPMSNAGLVAIIDTQAADITPEKSLLNGLPSVTEWASRLDQMRSWLTARADWIDSNYVRPPAFNQDGGAVPDGFLVVITATNGTIYFTTDSTDPRAPGGGIAPTAQAYQVPFGLDTQALVQARVRNGANWSGLTTAAFYPPQDLTGLAVTEIMYNPPAFGAYPGEELEFLELKNTGTNTLHLGTLTFTSGISFTFTNRTRLGPGEFLVLARNASAFQSKYPGVPIQGLYTGKLENAGETLRLATAAGRTVFDLSYNDRAPWPLAADGYGFSAVPLDAGAPPNSDAGAHWRASANLGGSPGADDPDPVTPRVVISEILSHTDPPDVDALELFNPAGDAADISGWFLSDDGTVPKKFRIPDDTVIAAGSYALFTEADFNPVPGTLYNFALDGAGDAAYLTAADAAGNLTGYGHGVDFGAAAAGVSFGRYLNSVGEEQFPAQLATTLETNNAGPVVGPVVITEIHYHPPAPAGTPYPVSPSALKTTLQSPPALEVTEEFVELRNVAATNVPLFHPDHPTNCWRLNGLNFTFPTNILLPRDGLLLVVATNPAGFRAKYAVPAAVPVLGPFIGALQNNGENLRLQRPDVPEPTELPYITVDQVRYSDKPPWPQAADGSGPSLQRLAPGAYGNDPINWVAAAPTPGMDLPAGESPVVTGQPQSQTLLAGQSASFTVSAESASPLQFRWRYNGAPVPDATNAVLEWTNAQPAQNGTYEALVFNAFGSTLSAQATLTVQWLPLIFQPPTNIMVRISPDRAAAPSTNATMTVLAVSARPLSYQWHFNGVPIPGATNPAVTVTNVQMDDWGEYTVAVSDEVGTVSAAAWLLPIIRPGFALSPLSQSVAVGGLVSLSAVATGWPPPFTFEWRLGSTVLVTNVQDSPVTFYSFTAPETPALLPYRAIVRNVGLPSGAPSWFAVITVLADSDGDGLPDDWESAHGLSTNNPADGLLDADDDGLDNAQEYLAGTDPTNALSFLKIDSLTLDPGATLAFGAVSNKTYTVQYADALDPARWFKLVDVAAHPTNRTELIFDADFRTNRFYRVATPRQP